MRRIALGLAAVVVLGLGGCCTAQPVGSPRPGATGYAYLNGYGVQRFIYPEPLVERAAVEAMQDMGMYGVHRIIKTLRVDLLGWVYDGRCILVAITPEDGSSVVTVRFDWYGDEPLTKILIDRIGIRLSTLPPTVNPPNEPRALTDSVTHRGHQVEGYRGAPLR